LNPNNPVEENKEKIIKIIKKTREGYCSANPDMERREGLYVELDEVFD
jgi:hypothetical protein